MKFGTSWIIAIGGVDKPAYAVIWFLARRTWRRVPLAILMILGWLWAGVLSLGPV